jgi:hypothetical protein
MVGGVRSRHRHFVYIAATRNSEPLSCVLPPLVDGIKANTGGRRRDSQAKRYFGVVPPDAAAVSNTLALVRADAPRVGS